jgi:hypothetical protein
MEFANPTVAAVARPLQLSGPSGTSSVSRTAKPVTGTLPATSVAASIDAPQINQ